MGLPCVRITCQSCQGCRHGGERMRPYNCAKSQSHLGILLCGYEAWISAQTADGFSSKHRRGATASLRQRGTASHLGRQNCSPSPRPCPDAPVLAPNILRDTIHAPSRLRPNTHSAVSTDDESHPGSTVAAKLEADGHGTPHRSTTLPGITDLSVVGSIWTCFIWFERHGCFPCWIKAMQDSGVNLGLEWPTSKTEPLVRFWERVKTHDITHGTRPQHAKLIHSLLLALEGLRGGFERFGSVALVFTASDQVAQSQQGNVLPRLPYDGWGHAVYCMRATHPVPDRAVSRQPDMPCLSN